MSDKKRVLFVDDNKMDRLILSKILEQLDLDYYGTSSAKEFISQIKIYRPDLCLVDLNINLNNDGRILVRAIRNTLGDQLPIIIISAVEESKEIALNLKNGANDFVCKPIDKAILSSKISNFLNSPDIKSKVLPLFRLPPSSPSKVKMELDLVLVELGETMIKFKSKTHLTNGCIFKLANSFFQEILPYENLTITVIGVDQGVYSGVIKEINEENIDKVRLHLSKLQKVPSSEI